LTASQPAVFMKKASDNSVMFIHPIVSDTACVWQLRSPAAGWNRLLFCAELVRELPLSSFSVRKQIYAHGHLPATDIPFFRTRRCRRFGAPDDDRNNDAEAVEFFSNQIWGINPIVSKFETRSLRGGRKSGQTLPAMN
jgi:hypothetical protein